MALEDILGEREKGSRGSWEGGGGGGAYLSRFLSFYSLLLILITHVIVS